MTKFLSPHEFALLLLLFNAPGQAYAGQADAVALQQARLIEIVSTPSGRTTVAVTSKGVDTLRRLQMVPAAGRAEASVSAEVSVSAATDPTRHNPLEG